MSTLANTDQIIEADYEIPVDLRHGDDVVPHIPDPLGFGKTVHYKTNSRTGQNADLVEIEFVVNGSPYLDSDGSAITKVTSEDPPLQLKLRGIFFARCRPLQIEGCQVGRGVVPRRHDKRGVGRSR